MKVPGGLVMQPQEARWLFEEKEKKNPVKTFFCPVWFGQIKVEPIQLEVYISPQ